MNQIENSFYTKSKKEQKQIQWKIAIAALLVNLLLFVVLWYVGWPFLIFIVFSITISIIAPFFDTPSLIKSGKLTYFSPLFLAEKERSGIINIHGGTLFDYVFVLDKKWSGQQRTKIILSCYVDGLLKMINHYQDVQSENLKIKGTSYILNERTANKIGLVKTRTSVVQTFILLLNYVLLTISYSISKARLSFPNVFKINTYEGNFEDIVKRKGYLLKLQGILKSDRE